MDTDAGRLWQQLRHELRLDPAAARIEALCFYGQPTRKQPRNLNPQATQALTCTAPDRPHSEARPYPQAVPAPRAQPSTDSYPGRPQIDLCTDSAITQADCQINMATNGAASGA